MKRYRLALLVILAALVSSCGVPASEAPPAAPTIAPTNAPATSQRFVIGTGGAGGVFAPYGEGLAGVLNAHIPNTEASAQTTGGSVDNMRLLQAGEVQLGLTTADSALDALNGAGVYEQSGMVPVATLAVLYQSFVHVIVSEGSGITNTMALKGHTVGVGASGSSTEAVADRLLAAAGLDARADVTRASLSLSDSVAAMKDEKIDAFFWVGGLPSTGIAELMTSKRVSFLDTSALLPALTKKYGPVYAAMTLPKGAYNTGADVPGIGVGNILVARQDMPASQVTSILAALFDHLDELGLDTPLARGLTLETAWNGSPIPFHTAAEAFYKERGVWGARAVSLKP